MLCFLNGLRPEVDICRTGLALVGSKSGGWDDKKW